MVVRRCVHSWQKTCLLGVREWGVPAGKAVWVGEDLQAKGAVEMGADLSRLDPFYI